MTNSNVFTLKGNKGTVITVAAVMADNVCIDYEYTVSNVADSAPDYYTDILESEADFILSKCVDGEAKNGDVWDTVVEDGQLTHEYLADTDYVTFAETFVFTVK